MKLKKVELFFTTVLVPIDFLTIFLAGLTAYYLRFSNYFRGVRPVIFNLPLNEYLWTLILISFLMIPVFFFAGVYRIKRNTQLAKELARIILACFMGLALIAILIFFQRELFDSRFIVLVGWALAIIYLIIIHSFLNWLQKKLHFYGIGVHKIILVGNSKTADNLIAEFSSNKYSGFEVVRRIRDFSLETSQELAEYIKDRDVDEIVQSDPNLSKVETLRLYDFATENQLTFKYVADLL